MIGTGRRSNVGGVHAATKDEIAMLPVVGTLTPSVHFAGRLEG